MKRAIPFLLAFVVVLILAVYLGLRYFGGEQNSPSPTSTPNNSSFQRTGNLVKNNPGLKPDTWYLIYEQQGAPALTSELVFNNSSTCLFGNYGLDCSKLTLNNGSRTTVEGKLSGNVVTVSKLIADPADYVKVTTPVPNQTVSNPIRISGEARGYWYFEASFPVSLVVNGQVVTTSVAQAKTDWMTTDFVPFDFTMPYSVVSTTTAELVFHNDNASGLPEFDREYRLPITITPSGPTRKVSLFYYNPQKDKDQSGNIICSSKGLEKVERTIPSTPSVLKDTINLLLAGNLTSEEKAKGITTEYPLVGVKLSNAVINNGVATLTFEDPNNRTGGGSCRVAILWAQIEATAKQFPTVKQVRFLPEELFQP